MVTEPSNMDRSDPFHASAALSLLPPSTRVQFQASNSSDLESIHRIMKSAGLRNAEVLLEETKAIVDNGSELLNANYPSFKASLGLDEPVAGAKVEKEKPRERRPGLGLKRARFSMKPEMSEPNSNLDLTFDVNQYPDPEEFFRAWQRFEKAEQEINRQKGVVEVDLNVNEPTNTRRRRPGLLGKSVRYKHRYSSEPYEDNDTVMPSQETLEQDGLCTQKSDLQQENTSHDVDRQELEFTGPITEKENRVNAFMDELLSLDDKDLDGDGVVSLLQEQFQIKPLDLSALRLPDFPAIKTDHLMWDERIPKARKSVVRLESVDKSTSGSKQREESPQSNLSSPTPPKSPFSSLVLLRKQILKSNPLRDPFSTLNVDLNDIDKNSNQVGSVSEFSRSSNLHGTHSVKGTKDLDTSHSDNRSDTSAETNVQSFNGDTNHSGSHAQMGDHDGQTDSDHMAVRGLEHLNEQSLEKNSDGETVVGQSESAGSMGQCNGQNHIDIRTADIQFSGDDNTNKKDECIIMQELSPAKVQMEADDTTNFPDETETDVQNNVSIQMDEHVENMPSAPAVSAEQEHDANDACIDENSDRPNSAAVQDHSMVIQNALPNTNSEQDTMKQPSAKKQPKGKSSRSRTREIKALKPRPSIADAGTLFENGVRRSKRIKTRPLEFWKGEKLLYGRVDKSLKLIGVKYMSPSGGNLKVKSYVSDKYKELVDLAARY